MAMIWPYVRFPTRQPIVTLGGLSYRSKPILSFTVIGPGGAAAVSGLADTGADDTILPESVAERAGLDLTDAPTGHTRGPAGLNRAALRYAEVTLRLTQGTERREWRGWVGFVAARLPYALVGQAGFLQFFTTTFRPDIEEFELSVNSLYPGT
jgi:hypothetical protein